MDKKYKEKLSHISDLFKLARIDDNQAIIENVFIERISIKMGVHLTDVQALRSDILKADKMYPISEFKRITNFYNLLLVMLVDNEVHEEEIHFCKDLGLKMGLNPYAVNQVIDKLLENNFKPLEAEIVTSIFKQFHN